MSTLEAINNLQTTLKSKNPTKTHEELMHIGYLIDDISQKCQKSEENIANLIATTNNLKHEIITENLKLKVDIVKYISENSWKTVSLLLGAQTGILTIFGFIQHFLLQRGI